MSAIPSDQRRDIVQKEDVNMWGAIKFGVKTWAGTYCVSTIANSVYSLASEHPYYLATASVAALIIGPKNYETILEATTPYFEKVNQGKKYIWDTLGNNKKEIAITVTLAAASYTHIWSKVFIPVVIGFAGLTYIVGNQRALSKANEDANIHFKELNTKAFAKATFQNQLKEKDVNNQETKREMEGVKMELNSLTKQFKEQEEELVTARRLNSELENKVGVYQGRGPSLSPNLGLPPAVEDPRKIQQVYQAIAKLPISTQQLLKRAIEDGGQGAIDDFRINCFAAIEAGSLDNYIASKVSENR